MKENPSTDYCSPQQVAKNDAELEAWNQFYETCSFFRCSEKNCLLLCETVFRYFLQRIHSTYPTLEAQFDDDEATARGDFAYFLDVAIEKRKLSKKNSEETALSDATGRKRYKDFIWTRARRQHNPLKEIRGLMMKGKGSVVADATIDYLRKEVWSIDIRELKNNATSKWIKNSKAIDSVVANTMDNEDRELLIFDLESDVMTFDGHPFSVNHWIEEPVLTSREKKIVQNVIIETFSSSELAICLAFPFRMLSHETLCKACGVGKSRIGAIWNNDILKDKIPRLIKSDLPVDFDTPETLRLFLSIAEEEVAKDPSFSDFLVEYQRQKNCTEVEKP